MIRLLYFSVLIITVNASMLHADELPPIKGEETAVLTVAPNVPPPIVRRNAKKVVVHLETTEVRKRLADGVDYTFWTFGGEVPGKFIRVREGDLIEFHLHNHPSSKMPHNIDLHAVNGPGGGASASFTSPGHSSVFSFRALNPGLYVYHCGTAPVGMHIANGMYGLILVEPKTGFPKVDHEFYVMQSEFYTKGKYGQPGLQSFSMEKAIQEQADYVVFNGSVGAMMGDNAPKVKVGDTIRLYVGNGGPNLVSSFHIIGEIFDRVYGEAGVIANQRHVQTTLIPAGGATIVEFKIDAPGTYILVDHSIFRAFNKGALGQIVAEGPDRKDVYTGKEREEVYLPEGSDIQYITGNAPPAVVAKNKAERISFGERIYKQNCLACHQAEGQGIPSAFPPLAKSDYLEDKEKSIAAVVAGLSGRLVVNGEEYNGVMPAWDLPDEDVANVLTYIYNSWGNDGTVITPEEVAKVRKVTPKNEVKHE